MTYDRTLTSALAFSKEGRLEEWIHLYLTSHGNNLPFSQGLKTLPRHYLGPVQMPITLFRRDCGRRYMNYLAEVGSVMSEMNYETGGRPCMRYKA